MYATRKKSLNENRSRPATQTERKKNKDKKITNRIQGSKSSPNSGTTRMIQRMGSHGKKKLLNVSGEIQFANGMVQTFNDRDQPIDIVKGHGGYTDEYQLAEDWVRTAYRLGKDDDVNITDYNFFTRK